MCACIELAMMELGIYGSILEIEEFNSRVAYMKFNARFIEDGEISYWWDIDNHNDRIDYFDYLIRYYRYRAMTPWFLDRKKINKRINMNN